MRISEYVTIDKIKEWKNTDVITISAQTGSGKSYFIKNILYAFAKKEHKKILMLIHRTNCVNQFQKEIEQNNKIDTIDIMTYQALESIIYNHKTEINLNQYEYIVCDEFHYFLSDAAFNKTTDISLDLILAQINITRIFMSATGNHMKRYINKVKGIETIDYRLLPKYSFIKSLVFFNKNETMEKFIEEAIVKNEKGIFFIESAKKAYDLFSKYPQYTLFNCSKSNLKYYKYVDQNKIDKMLINEKFDELILITTTCLDTGVNINDRSVEHIIIDVEDIGTIIQCLGRRRILDNKDKLHVYIKAINNKQLGGKETQLKKKIEMADYFIQHTVKEYIEKFSRKADTSNIVYDAIVNEQDKGTKKLNELMYFKCKLDINDINKMKKLGEWGYNKFVAKIFGIDRYILLEEIYKKGELEEYLQSIVGKRLFKDEQKELIDMIGLKDKKGRIRKSYGVFNEYFIEEKLPFIIYSKSTTDKKRKSVTYWIIDQLEERIQEN